MARPKILIVDDSADTRTWLAELLTIEGYQVTQAAAGAEALEQISTHSFDLAVIDLRLPDLDGAEVMRAVHRQSPSTQLIMLTGAPSVESAIEAVRSDAHEYLLKPSSPEEIVAAVRAGLAKRGEALRQSELLEVVEQAVKELRESAQAPVGEGDAAAISGAGISLDLMRQTGALDGEPLILSPIEFRLLAFLMAHPGRVISATDIVRHVHGYRCTSADAQAILRPAVSRLRRKLAGHPRAENAIVNIRSIGYMFALNASGPITDLP